MQFSILISTLSTITITLSYHHLHLHLHTKRDKLTSIITTNHFTNKYTQSNQPIDNNSIDTLKNILDHQYHQQINNVSLNDHQIDTISNQILDNINQTQFDGMDDDQLQHFTNNLFTTPNQLSHNQQIINSPLSPTNTLPQNIKYDPQLHIPKQPQNLFINGQQVPIEFNDTDQFDVQSFNSYSNQTDKIKTTTQQLDNPIPKPYLQQSKTNLQQSDLKDPKIFNQQLIKQRDILISQVKRLNQIIAINNPTKNDKHDLNNQNANKKSNGKNNNSDGTNSKYQKYHKNKAILKQQMMKNKKKVMPNMDDMDGLQDQTNDADLDPMEQYNQYNSMFSPIFGNDDHLLLPHSFNVSSCSQVVSSPINYIPSLYNSSYRIPATLSMNVYTVNIFYQNKIPQKLMISIDFWHVEDILSIKGAPGCVQIISKIERKEMVPCFNNLQEKQEFIQAFLFFKKCYEPIPIEPNKPICEDSQTEEIEGIHV